MLGRDPPMPTTTAIAPAKINLFLRVLGRRDDGFHDLESLIVRIALPVALADRLEIHADADPDFTTLSFSLDVGGDPSLARGVPVDESNLVLKAAKALAERTGTRGFADIRLEKRIPSAAGLGGGSSDAAATLRALNELWGLRLDARNLSEVAAEVGSDVPAMLWGAPVLVGGRGERISPAKVGGHRWALVTFDFGVSTRDAFGWWDQDGGTTGPDPGRLIEALAGAPRAFARLLFNDLETPVIRRYPSVGEAKAALLREGAAAALMCGSGPSMAGLLGPGRTRLSQSAERDLDDLSGRPVAYVETMGMGPDLLML